MSIYFKNNSNLMEYSTEIANQHRDWYRTTATEALATSGDFSKFEEYKANEGPATKEFYLNRHFFMIISYEEMSDDDIVKELVSRHKDGVLLWHENWEGDLYHHSKDPMSVIRDGLDAAYFRHGDHTSFGPGFYCYYKESDLLLPNDEGLLVGRYSGPFLTCSAYFGDITAERYGYLPAGYQTIQWELKNPTL